MGQSNMKDAVGPSLDLPSCHQHSTPRSDNMDDERKYNLPFSACCQHACLSEHRTTVVDSSSKRGARTNMCVASCILLCLIICCSSLFYTLSTMAVMEARLAFVENKLAVCTGKPKPKSLSWQQNIPEESRWENSLPEHFRRKRRNAGSSSQSFVHLVGRGHTDYTTPVDNITLFKWNKSNQTTFLGGLRLTPNPNDISRIKITHTGVYLVYSQVVLHGRTNLDVHYHCSHRTVHRNLHGPWTPILSSVLTQDNLGRMYHNTFPDQNYKALDSQLQMGVFHLLANDEVAVQRPPYCSNSGYSMTAENTYFGVVKLG